MVLAAFEPGIFFLLLWGLISFLTRKKKKKIDTDSREVTAKPKKDLFARLQKLQEHLSQEVDIFPSSSPPLDAEEEYFAEEDKYGFEEPEILEPKSEDVHEAEGYAFETAIKAPTTVHDNWLKQNLSRKLELRKLMVLKDVLGEPRSIKPYSGDYFQS